jgi:hypothetical protein
MARMKTKDRSGPNSGTRHGGGNGGGSKNRGGKVGENARARRAVMMCAPTVARKVTGPRNVAIRSATRLPRPT